MGKKDGKGLRYNEGKLRHDLVYPWAHERMVEVLTDGANKYAERNWERGMSWSSVLASLKRHLTAFENGEDFDPETGRLHMAHLACNAHFLTAYYKLFPQGDDRRHEYLTIPKIGLDIDEVLCDWVGDWTKYRNLEVPSSWSFDRGLVDEFKKMEKEGRLNEFYLNLKPLMKGEDLPFEPDCYITSRPVSSEISEQWLDKHGFPSRPVFTTTKERTKVVIAKERELDIFIVDGYHNFVDLNNAGICCFLYDAKHNQRYDVGHKRITNLNDIIK